MKPGHTETTQWRTKTRRLVESLLDILVATIYLVVAGAVMLTQPDGSAVKALVVLPLVGVLPGYAIVVALYPREMRVSGEDTSKSADAFRDDSLTAPSAELILGDRPGWLVRGVLSVGISLGVVSTLGVAIDLIGFNLGDEWAVTASIVGIILIGLGSGVVRRVSLDYDQRFKLRHRTALGVVPPIALPGDSLSDTMLTLVLVVLVLASVGGLGYALVSPPTGEQYTTLMLVTNDGGDEFVASDYPTSLTPGEQAELYVGIENHEGQTVEYTVVAVLQRVDRTGESASVVDRQRLGSIDAELAANETTYVQHSFAPEMSGTDLRLIYLLYRGDAPEQPTADSAYRYTHLWLDVTSESPLSGTQDDANGGLQEEPESLEQRRILRRGGP